MRGDCANDVQCSNFLNDYLESREYSVSIRIFKTKPAQIMNLCDLSRDNPFRPKIDRVHFKLFIAEGAQCRGYTLFTAL